jgi:hypothetical protein
VFPAGFWSCLLQDFCRVSCRILVMFHTSSHFFIFLNPLLYTKF